MSTIVDVLREKTDDPSIETISEGVEKALIGGGSGGGGGVLVVHDVNGTLDKTWNEILEAEYSVITMYEEGTEQGEPFKERDYYIVQTIYGRGELYSVSISGGMTYHSDNPNGYPAVTS